MRAQTGGQIAVQLDHGEAAKPLDQRLRQRRQARADLDHGITGARIDLAHDGVDDGTVAEKVLPETFAGPVLFHEVGPPGQW